MATAARGWSAGARTRSVARSRSGSSATPTHRTISGGTLPPMSSAISRNQKWSSRASAWKSGPPWACPTASASIIAPPARTARDVGVSLLLFLPWYLGIILVSALSAVIVNGGQTVPSNSRLVFVQRPNGVGLLVLALLVTAVAAPICEEIFFRGMLFRLLRRRLALWAAVLLSALAFALAHASPAVSLALLPSFTYMGVILALVYVRTGWLTNSILLHGMNNALVTVVAFNLATR